MGALAVPLPKSVLRLVATSPYAREKVIDEAVHILRSRNSLWPVKTGRSIRGFRRTGSGGTSRIYNPVRYASYVERRNRQPAVRTLMKYRDRLVAVAKKARTTPGKRLTPADRQQQQLLSLIRSFAAQRNEEQFTALYSLYLAEYKKNGRAPRIPKWLQLYDLQLRRAAQRRARDR